MLVEMETFCVPEVGGGGALQNKRNEAADQFFHAHRSFVHILNMEGLNFQFALLVCGHIFMSVLMKNAPGLVTQRGW